MSVHTRWLPLLAVFWAVTPAVAQREMVFPPREYYIAFSPYFEGDYGTALDTFQSAARGGVRSTEGLWIDSVCYHAMIGECYYKMGDIPKALAQYDSALKLATFHGNWLLRIEFPEMIEPSASVVRNTITWGVSKRNTRMGRIPDTMMSLQGRPDNQQVLRSGGVSAPLEFYQLNVKEILRCTALAIRRRREIMGPVCQHHELTGQMLSVLSRRATRPNHWSQGWMSSQLGMAYASTGKTQQAVSELTKSLVLAGQYDHELTAMGLLELGKLAFEQGQYNTAATYFLETTFVAAAFDQYDVMQEAFRGGLVTHLVSGQKGLYAPLGPAAAWARRYSRALQADLLLMAAENYAAMGETAQATRLLAQARQAVGTREMRSGVFGARFNYQSAIVNLQRGNLSAGGSDWAATMLAQKTSSRRLFQIGLADTLYASGTISDRVADLLFNEVLREPTASDWTVEPMETLAAAVTPNPGPLQHWFDVALKRNEKEKAIEISDRIRRHRFFSTLPMGGRLIAFRWILEAPESALSQQARLQRQDLLRRYPNYAKLSAQAATIRQGLEALPLAPDDAGQTKQQTQLFEQLAEVSTAQELILRELAMRREPAELVFPPLRSVKEIQEAMPEGQLILAYLVTDRYVAGFALSKQNQAVWQLKEPAKVAAQIADLLKQMGLSNRKVAVDAAKLKDSSWKETSADLLLKLSNNADADNWAEYSEVVVVPDGPLWYVPFEALRTAGGANGRPLISEAMVRYVPTLSLANGDMRGHKRDARTAVVTGRMLPGQDVQVAADAFDDIRLVLPDANRIAVRLPAPSAYLSAACDRAIVLNDLEQNARSAYGWSPMYLDRAKPGDSLDSWLGLPWHGPAQIVLPGFHTPAEDALKRGGTGTEVFLAVCGLMASGSRSVLLSRWPVGGQSTFDLIREYVQELPFTSAAEAWQRSVRLAQGTPVDPELEPRVNASGLRGDLNADHPFFWSGYLLADTGSAPKQDEP